MLTERYHRLFYYDSFNKEWKYSAPLIPENFVAAKDQIKKDPNNTRIVAMSYTVGKDFDELVGGAGGAPTTFEIKLPDVALYVLIPYTGYEGYSAPLGIFLSLETAEDERDRLYAKRRSGYSKRGSTQLEIELVAFDTKLPPPPLKPKKKNKRVSFDHLFPHLKKQ